MDARYWTSNTVCAPLQNKQEENMKKAILATKVGMTQIFNEDGVLVPVTVLQAGPCVVTQVKTVEKLLYSTARSTGCFGFSMIRNDTFLAFVY